jgi:hypothetical protein
MSKFEIFTKDLLDLSSSERKSIFDNLLILIEIPILQLFIDNVHIKDRDELHDWKVSNLKLFKK